MPRGPRRFLLAVDSIQSLRDPSGWYRGTVASSRVRGRLVGLAKSSISVLVTGHVTRTRIAGPRALEHAVDVVLAFDGDPFGAADALGRQEQIRSRGRGGLVRDDGARLREIDPGDLLLRAEASPATASRWRVGELSRSRSRRSSPEAKGRPAGKRAGSISAGSSSSGRCSTAPVSVWGDPTCSGPSRGARLDDPACDLAVAAAVASAAAGVPAPPASAFVGEIGLTGVVRAAPGMAARISAARAAGLRTVFVPEGTEPADAARWFQSGT